MELSGRFYIRKRKPVGSEVQGHKGESWEEEEDPPQTPPREGARGPCQRNSPARTLMQQTALWYLSCVYCSWMPIEWLLLSEHRLRIFIYRKLSEPTVRAQGCSLYECSDSGPQARLGDHDVAGQRGDVMARAVCPHWALRRLPAE